MNRILEPVYRFEYQMVERLRTVTLIEGREACDAEREQFGGGRSEEMHTTDLTGGILSLRKP